MAVLSTNYKIEYIERMNRFWSSGMNPLKIRYDEVTNDEIVILGRGQRQRAFKILE